MVKAFIINFIFIFLFNRFICFYFKFLRLILYRNILINCFYSF